MAQAVEHLPSKHKVLNSKPSTLKKQKKNDSMSFSIRKIDGTGEHHVKQNKPASERQISHFSLIYRI
jgi:hypothetical protein